MGAEQLAEVFVKIGAKSTLPSDLATAKSQTEAFNDAMAVGAAKGASAFTQYINEVHALQGVFNQEKIRADEYFQAIEKSMGRLQRGMGVTRESAVAMATALAPSTPITPSDRRRYREIELENEIKRHTGTKNELSQGFIDARNVSIMEQYNKEMSELPAEIARVKAETEAAAAAEKQLNEQLRTQSQILAGLETPLEKYNKEMAKLRAAHALPISQGGISDEKFAAGKRKADAEFMRSDPAEIEKAAIAARHEAEAEREVAAAEQFAERAIRSNKTALEEKMETLAKIKAARAIPAGERGHMDTEQALRASEAAHAKFSRDDPGEIARRDEAAAAASAAATARAAAEKEAASAKAQQAADAEKAKQEVLNKAKAESNALDQRGETIKVQFATAQERHNLRMKEYNTLLNSGRISRELFNRAEKESLDIQKAEASMAGRGGILGRSGGMLMAQGSYAIQDFATVISMKGMGMGDAMRAASNNIGMMAMMLGGPVGSIAAAAVTLGAVLPGMWSKFSDGAEHTKEKLEAAKKALEDFNKSAQDYAAQNQKIHESQRTGTSEQATSKIESARDSIRQKHDESRVVADDLAWKKSVLARYRANQENPHTAQNEHTQYVRGKDGKMELRTAHLEGVTEEQAKTMEEQIAAQEAILKANKKEVAKYREIERILNERQAFLQEMEEAAAAQESQIKDEDNAARIIMENRRSEHGKDELLAEERDRRRDAILRGTEDGPERAAALASNDRRYEKERDGDQFARAARKEERFLEMEDKGRWGNQDSRVGAAERRQRQLEDDLRTVRDSGRSEDDINRVSRDLISGADKEFKSARDQGRQKNPVFMGAEQLYKHIQEGLSTDPVVEQQKKTNEKLDEMRRDLSRLKAEYG